MNNNLMNGLLKALPSFIFNSPSESNVLEIESELPVDSSGSTAVARYLDNLPRVTGVAKYLKKRQDDPATGVAKIYGKTVLGE